MSDTDFLFSKEAREIEKRVDKFAIDTIKDTEGKSKMLSKTMSQIANLKDIGNDIEININNLGNKIKLSDPSCVDFINRKYFWII